MLQHEPQEQAAATPAAQIRVTAEELAQAINALEASKEEAAACLAGTVPIGEVVQELKLEATPEEVWAQVQRQRARLAAEAAAAQAAAAQKEAQKEQAAAMQAAAAQTLPRPRRRWRWWALIGIGWAVYGIAHGSLLHVQTPGAASSPGITVNGDHEKQAYNAEGKDVVINGDGNTITLHGRALSVTVNGDNDTVIGETARSVETNGNNDTVKWSGAPAGEITDNGHDNHITVTTP